MSFLRSLLCGCSFCPFYSDSDLSSFPRPAGYRSRPRGPSPIDEGDEEVYEKDVDDESSDEEAEEDSNDGDTETQHEGRGEGDAQPGHPSHTPPSIELKPIIRDSHKTEERGKGVTPSKSKPSTSTQAPIPLATPVKPSAQTASASPLASLTSFFSSPSPTHPPPATSSSPTSSQLKLPPPPADAPASSHYYVSRAADAQRRAADAKEREKDFVYTEKEWDIDAFYNQHVKGKGEGGGGGGGGEGGEGGEGGGEEGGKGKKGSKKKQKGVLEEMDVEPNIDAILDELEGGI